MLKMAPAMGALKVAAMPAEAPQAAMVRSVVPRTLTSCPSVEPNALPICTIGPSRPTDPPLPILTAEATVFANATRGRILPLRTVRASITSGSPLPRASHAK